MYIISDKQIEFILDDITNKGITIESLRQNILDHICCIIENEYDESEDFEIYYAKTITRFYENKLSEIEVETVLHLKFKNYYAMKKTMMYSGAISVAVFLIGSLFKIMHWPGAGILLTIAIFTATLIFLPLVFLLKSREEVSVRDKAVVAAGSLAMMLFCLGVLFRLQHWPGSYYMWLTAIAISFFLFIPLYYFNGIKKPEAKVNTIVFTVLMVLATGIQFSLINTNPNTKETQLRMHGFLQNEDLIKKMQDKHINDNSPELIRIVNTCNSIKELIFQNAIGLPSIPADFEARKILMSEGNLGNEFTIDHTGSNLVLQLKQEIEKFNSTVKESNRIPISSSIFNIETERLYSNSSTYVLNNISQIEMYALLAD